jgi:CPA1 family monovalent cation:H+ antiporter
VLTALFAAPEQGQAVLATVESFAFLLGVAALVAVAARRVSVPYSVALILVGLSVSIVSPNISLAISPELVLIVLLPGLVFEAAYQLDVREVRRSFGGIVILAAPGVLVSAAIVAIVLNLATGLSLDLAFVVGAVVSATDPVAVLSIFRHLRSPARLATLVEAESLFNDGTAIVVFVIALRAIAGAVTPVDALLSFISVVAVSAVIGAVAGLAASWAIATVDDHLIELTISVVLAYGTYLVADELHQSGIIATVIAGVFLGSYGRRIGMSQRTQDAVDIVWEFVAFILNALVFLLVGLATSIGELGAALPAILWGCRRDSAGARLRGLRAPGDPRPAGPHGRRYAGDPAPVAPRDVLGRAPGRGRRRARPVPADGFSAARDTPGRRLRDRPFHTARPGHHGRARHSTHRR